MGVKDKVRTDLDLHKESILGMGCMLLKGLNPKVGVGQIWRQYLKKKTMHTFENLNIVLTRTPTPTPTPTPGWQQKLSRDIVEKTHLDSHVYI